MFNESLSHGVAKIKTYRYKDWREVAEDVSKYEAYGKFAEKEARRKSHLAKPRECVTDGLPLAAESGEMLRDEPKFAERRKLSDVFYAVFLGAWLKYPGFIPSERLVALRDCGSWLLFLIGSENQKHLKKANFCRHRLCPMCNWRRSLKLFGQNRDMINYIFAEDKITIERQRKDRSYKPDELPVRFLLLTLTVKNVSGNELSKELDRIDTAFKKLVQQKKDAKNTFRVKKHIKGYMRAAEVTYNALDDTYHPHLHIILAVDYSYFRSENYVTEAEWRDIWRDCLGINYDPWIDIQAIKDYKHKGMAGAVAEVSKYPTKLDSIVYKINALNIDKYVDVVYTMHMALKCRRMITFGGRFRKVRRKLRMDDIETGDLVNLKDKTDDWVGQILYRWNARVGAYIC